MSIICRMVVTCDDCCTTSLGTTRCTIAKAFSSLSKQTPATLDSVTNAFLQCICPKRSTETETIVVPICWSCLTTPERTLFSRITYKDAIELLNKPSSSSSSSSVTMLFCVQESFDFHSLYLVNNSNEDCYFIYVLSSPSSLTSVSWVHTFSNQMLTVPYVVPDPYLFQLSRAIMAPIPYTSIGRQYLTNSLNRYSERLFPTHHHHHHHHSDNQNMEKHIPLSVRLFLPSCFYTNLTEQQMISSIFGDVSFEQQTTFPSYTNISNDAMFFCTDEKGQKHMKLIWEILYPSHPSSSPYHSLTQTIHQQLDSIKDEINMFIRFLLLLHASDTFELMYNELMRPLPSQLSAYNTTNIIPYKHPEKYTNKMKISGVEFSKPSRMMIDVDEYIHENENEHVTMMMPSLSCKRLLNQPVLNEEGEEMIIKKKIKTDHNLFILQCDASNASNNTVSLDLF